MVAPSAMSSVAVGIRQDLSCATQINDKLERARLLDEQAAAMRRSTPPRSSGAVGWLGGALSALPGLGRASDSGGESLRQSAEALQAMELTLAGDVSELVAEQQRARVRHPSCFACASL